MKTKITVILFLVFTIINTLKAQIKVFSGGSVSIGNTASPFTNLQVFGNSLFSSTTGTPTSAAYIRGLNVYSTATTPDYTWYNNDQTGIYHPASNTIGFSAGGVEQMLINTNGLAIKTVANYVTPLCIIAQSANAVGYTMRYGGADNFYVSAAGWAYSQGYYLGSDKSFKKDINTVTNALDKVLKLRGVTYKLNRTDSNSVFNDEVLMGVVAQEVETIIPEVVKTLPNGTKAVAYQNLIGLLIEAIKEQQTQIKKLGTDLNTCCTMTQARLQSSSIIPLGNVDPLIGTSAVATVASSAALYQNIPNPFNKETSISYYLPKETKTAALLLFDMQGKLIKKIDITSFENGTIIIAAQELQPGMYLYTLIADSQEIATMRMILTE